MNYYQFHIGDYAVHTRHLTLMEDLAYRRMLDAYYTSESALPSDADAVARLLGMRSEADAVRSVLSEFFLLGDDGLYHSKRCDSEIAKFRSKQAIAQANGVRGGRPAKPKGNPQETGSVSFANPEETGSKANQEPRTNNHKPVTKKKDTEPLPALPEFVDLDDWKAYAEMRAKSRYPVTAAAARLIFGELRKIFSSGLDPNEALRNSVMNGWRGVFPPKQAAAARPANGATNGKFNGRQHLRDLDAAERSTAGRMDAEAATADDGHLWPSLPKFVSG